MKNLKNIWTCLGLATLMLFNVSCKKDFVCKCKKTSTDITGNTNVQEDGTYIFKDSKIRAEKRCLEQEKVGYDDGEGYKRECELE